MADVIINEKETFEYTYSAAQQEEVERIKAKYLPKQESKLEQLKKLDKSAEHPGTVVSIAVGTIGTLIMGVGMCCTMVWNTSVVVFVAGIIIGILGMAIAGVAYPIYKSITKKQRAKIAEQILKLSAEICL